MASSRRRPSRFERAYHAGVVAEIPAPGAGTARGSSSGAGGAGGASRGDRAAGCVLTPTGPMEDGYVVSAPATRSKPSSPSSPKACESRPPVGDPARPAGPARPPRVQRVRGLGAAPAVRHPLPVARQPDLPGLVRDSQDRLLEAGLGDEELRYAEIRALVGGVTAIQGASGRTRSTEEALVRNIDLRIFGQHRARAMIDLPSPSSRDADKLRDIVAEIGRGQVEPSTSTWPRARPTTSAPRTSSAGWSTPTRGSPRPPC